MDLEVNEMSFEAVEKFEKNIADWFGAPYAVAVDSCTHGIELSLRLLQVEKIKVPTRTYIYTISCRKIKDNTTMGLSRVERLLFSYR